MLDGRLATVSMAAARIIPANLALEFDVLAIEHDETSLTLASAVILPPAALARLERATERKITVQIFAAHALAPEIARCYGTTRAELDHEDQSAVASVEALLRRAILERASDMHLSMRGDVMTVRLRIDGALRSFETIDSPLATRVLSRLKLIAGMDIAERRLPQDGRLFFTFQGRNIDVRAASMPTEIGERIALRFLDTQTKALALTELGMPNAVLNAITPLLRAASGLFLICGPTGSGKTTTLYAALESIDRTTRHICTVEDPVERRISDISQVSVNVRSGLSFAVALRALLRQDPDVIMIGEIRDEETAQTAVNAALTGQLVLASVHSAYTYGAFERMRELGVRPSSLATVLSGVLAQRLVRRLCATCRLAVDNAFIAVGCERCAQTGYRGRAPLFDALTITEPVRAELQAQSALPARGISPMLAAQANQYLRDGITTIDEIARVAPLWAVGNAA